MNREIKFRAWHKKLKKMFMVKTIDWLIITNGTNEIDTVHLVEMNIIDKVGIYCKLEELELMQVTGLPDKNKKDIYEGDIVVNKEYSGETTAPVEVYFREGGFKPFCEPCTDDTTDWYYYGATTEIIGNIYENPELIGGLNK